MVLGFGVPSRMKTELSPVAHYPIGQLTCIRDILEFVGDGIASSSAGGSQDPSVVWAFVMGRSCGNVQRGVVRGRKHTRASIDRPSKPPSWKRQSGIRTHERSSSRSRAWALFKEQVSWPLSLTSILGPTRGRS